MIMNTEEFNQTNQRLQREQEEFFNNICHLIKQAETVEQKAQERYYEGYQKGLDTAWELARRITSPKSQGGMTTEEFWDCFQKPTILSVLNTSASEALQDYKDWKAKEENKDQPQEKIKIGDVVDYDGCEYVVIKEFDDFYGVINPTTNCSRTIFKNATKTGKHYDLPWQKQCQ